MSDNLHILLDKWSATNRSFAYIVVDVQKDFVEGGALGVTGGNEVARRISKYLRHAQEAYGTVVATRDWHIAPGSHFEKWGRHCVADTEGAEFHPDIKTLLDDYFNGGIVISKGLYNDGYSGFDGSNLHTQHVLDKILFERGVKNVVIGGIATDYCVRATALDAAGRGYSTYVVTDHVAGVAIESTQDALQELEDRGVHLVSEDALARISAS